MVALGKHTKNMWKTHELRWEFVYTWLLFMGFIVNRKFRSQKWWYCTIENHILSVYHCISPQK